MGWQFLEATMNEFEVTWLLKEMKLKLIGAQQWTSISALFDLELIFKN